MKTKAELLRDPEFYQFVIKSGIDPANFSEEELQAIYADYKGRGAELDRQQAYADTLRTTPLPGGNQTGGIFRASNPLEMVGSLAQRGVGAAATRDIRGQREDLSAQDALARQAYAREMAKAVRGSGVAPPAAPANAPRTPEEEEWWNRQRMGLMGT